MQTVFQCEWDKHATKILQRHWPDVPRWDDVSTLTGKHILQHAPVIDIVAWGSPCQDLSVAGKRAGLDGQRSGLFHQGIRIIKELLEETNGRYPRISLWENVYGALNSNRGADFGVILDQMAEAGSLVQEWRVLDAQYFGVPQRRRRVFLVSIFDPATAARCPDPLLPLRQGVQWNPATSTTPRQDTPSEIARCLRVGTGVGERGGGSDNLVVGHRMRGFGDYADDDTASAIKARDHKDATDLISEEKSGTLAARANDQTIFQPTQTTAFQPGTMIRMSGGVWDELAPTLRAEAKRGDNEPHVAIQYDGYNQKINDTDVSVTLRLGRDSSDFVAQPVDAAGFKPGASANAHSIGYEEGLSPSLEAGGGGNNRPAVLEPTMAVRRLTPVECERLMGWPDGWTEGQADTHRYKQCGNGVASPVATWIGEQLLQLDKDNHAEETT